MMQSLQDRCTMATGCIYLTMAASMDLRPARGPSDHSFFGISDRTPDGLLPQVWVVLLCLPHQLGLGARILDTALLWVSTIWAYGSAPGEGQKAPLFVRYALSLWYIIQPMSLVVVILYWTVVNQFWDPYAIEFSSLWAHLLNWMVLIVHLFASNLPWSFKNGIWAFMFSVVFVIWTIIHYFLEIGKGIPCDDYEIEKCPIYNTFDWNKPGQTIGICVGASVALLVVLGLYTGLFRCRDACSGRGRTSTGEKDVEAAAAS